MPNWLQRVACLRSVVALDLRSLALFRVALGLMLLGDLVRRAQDVSAFYTDSGVYPRKLLAGPAGLWRITLHAANGQVLYEQALFLVAFAAAAALLAGWQTRRATFISWIFFVSLLNRVPLLVTPGEMLLAAILFWAIFLPLNAYWSADAAIADAAPTGSDINYASWASSALLLQMVVVFTMITAVAGNGSPVHAVLERDDYLSFAGFWLQRHPTLTQVTAETATTIGLICPILLLFPARYLRRFAIAALALIQLGAEFVLKQNLLGWAALVALIAFLDPGIWDWLSRTSTQASPLRIYHDRNFPRSLRTHRLLRTFLALPATEFRIAQDEPRTDTLLRNNQSWIVIDHDESAYLRWDALVLLLRRSPLLAWLGWGLSRLPLTNIGNTFYGLTSRYRKTGRTWVPRPKLSTGLRSDQFVVPLCLLLMLVWNLGASGFLPVTATRILTPAARLLRLDQHWNRALPQPSTAGSGWFVAPGVLANHRMVDAMRPGIPLNFSATSGLSSLQGNMDWHRYLDRLRGRDAEDARARYARFLCHWWNRRTPSAQKLLSLQLVYLFEPTALADHNAIIEQEILWRQNCGAATNPRGP